MRRFPVLALALALLPAGAAAQIEAAAQKPKQAVLAAYEAYQKARADYRKISQEAMEKLRENRGDAEAVKEYRATLAEPRKRQTEAREAFIAAFAESDWGSWDVNEHRKLVEEGLMGAAQQLLDEEPDKSIEAYQALLKRVPNSRAASLVKSYYLPTAYAASGDFDDGIAFLKASIGEASEAEAANMHIALGDMLAVTGDIDAARAEYQKAVEGIPDDVDRRDPRSRAKRYGELRLALVGNPAPEIDSENWIGGNPKPLGALQGKVVVLDFWATWCGPCRHVMPALSELYEERKDDGLRILGVTRFYSNGYLPENPDQMLSGGESVRDMDEASFQEHLNAFKQNTGIAYPFVVGTKDDFENYKVSGIPTVVVVDTAGKVVMVGVGSGSEPSVRAAVDAALAKATK